MTVFCRSARRAASMGATSRPTKMSREVRNRSRGAPLESQSSVQKNSRPRLCSCPDPPPGPGPGTGP